MKIPLSIFFLIMLLSATVSAAVWEKEASVHWKAVPLRESLDRFAETQQIGIFLDRRLDPSTPLDFDADRQPISILLGDFAKTLDIGFCPLGSVAYFGPKESVRVLPLLVADRRRSTPLFKRKFPLSIPLLASPKEVLEELATKNGLRWANLDQLPHDLWAARQLPPMALGELFCILLIGFDKTFEISDNGKTLRIVPIPFESLLATDTVPPEKSETKTKAAGRKTPLSQKRFTLTLKDQRLDAVLTALAARLELTLEIDKPSLEKKQVSLNQPVSFDVKNATAQELFQKLLSPLSVEYTIRGDTLIIK